MQQQHGTALTLIEHRELHAITRDTTHRVSVTSAPVGGRTHTDARFTAESGGSE